MAHVEAICTSHRKYQEHSFHLQRKALCTRSFIELINDKRTLSSEQSFFSTCPYFLIINNHRRFARQYATFQIIPLCVNHFHTLWYTL
jgi:hypothetical protein